MVAGRPGITEWNLPDGTSSEHNSPEKGSAKCPECVRLWKVYAVATRKFLDAILAQEDSEARRGIDQIDFLKDQALEATQWRELARKAIRDHAATHANRRRARGN